MLENNEIPDIPQLTDLQPKLDPGLLNDYQQKNKTNYPYLVIRRNGKRTPFDQNKIMLALTKAFLAVEGGLAADSSRIHQIVEKLTNKVVAALIRRLSEKGIMHIEDIQDQVELALMRAGEQKVARCYVLYRAEHENRRAPIAHESIEKHQNLIHIVMPDQSKQIFNVEIFREIICSATKQLNNVDDEDLLKQISESIFDGISMVKVVEIAVLAARSLIDQEPDYSLAAARLLLVNLRIEACSFIAQKLLEESHYCELSCYSEYFEKYIHKAVEHGLLDEELTRFDLPRLASAIKPERDHQFKYLGLQTLYDRYLIHINDIRVELPQAFFMRVAMGLAINEIDRETQAIAFYNLLSSFDFMSSTPTLFNSGTNRPQLSSCYLTSIPDHLSGIYHSLHDNAMLSKYAGGLGNDWSRVRGMGARISGTNGRSQGIIPFLKVANDTAVAVNQGGKRKGAVCAYLETWHIDIEEFLELRKNTGDERRRTHDMNSANWIPDLFMQRVVEENDWTLFSPDDVEDLHSLTGKAFATAYINYEEKAKSGDIEHFKQIKAVDLWRKMLGMLFETGHPWITFKDPCNIRYTNQHQGIVNSSNLCTEITLHTNDDEIAVCNLGSINLSQHLQDGELDKEKLASTISCAMRMLDNVIDYNYYSVPQARQSNLKHRPVGLGLMGFQDALYQKGIAYASEEAVRFADESMELISYYALQSSCQLAQERGSYKTFSGSLWSKGILPIDSINLLAEERGNYINQDCSSTLNWNELRNKIVKYGIRNSNCLAIAPTATIANICGINQSIEPLYQNLYVKSNLSGEFSVTNQYLIDELKKLNLWDEVMINDLKYFDGSIQSIERIPSWLKNIYATAFEIDSRWLIEAASRRQKWIDQAQSLNLYMAEPSGKKLDQLYKLAWVRGLKTTYYLRSLGATQAEKNVQEHSETKICSILEPDCEACQ